MADVKNGLFASGKLRGIREQTIKLPDGGSFVKVTAVLDKEDGYDLFVSQNGEGGQKMKADLESRVGSRITVQVYPGNYREIRYLALVS